MKDLRITIRAVNNQIRERREGLGLSQAALAEAAGIPVNEVSYYECLRQNPCTKDGSVRGSATKLAEFFGVRLLDLWPESVLAVEEPYAERKINAEEFALLSQGTPYERLIEIDRPIERKELTQRVGEALKLLTPRERFVLRKRFGLESEEPHTLEDTASALETSRERVRQIEAKALRKLRHPMRAHILKPL